MLDPPTAYSTADTVTPLIGHGQPNLEEVHNNNYKSVSKGMTTKK